jgi:hypothetical protein
VVATGSDEVLLADIVTAPVDPLRVIFVPALTLSTLAGFVPPETNPAFVTVTEV